MPFLDRAEAGRRLGQALQEYAREDVVVLALPRGGVPVAAEVARKLKARLDLLIVRKIGVPWQPELAMGAIVDAEEPIVVRNDDILRHEFIREEQFAATCKSELAEIARRRQAYCGDRPPVPVRGRVAILVDDGIATGATVKAAIRGLRLRQPQRIVLAVPVAPMEAIEDLRSEVDEIVCLETPAAFEAISRSYRDFPQLADVEVTDILARFNRLPGRSD
ncbi:phosphoribosyltransferase [Stappia sp. F7233]|uniref:Phosphoribosyltransferase n=1 Tax=Stappia albiluteola TaxID=2758565 RepID=A0A839ALW2_9HYPH|nr:phosphoribosyltransferase [Stappia albiluteola]MBA5779419.1 phosphoribosyltransferase [Stappia albiluteola]